MKNGTDSSPASTMGAADAWFHRRRELLRTCFFSSGEATGGCSSDIPDFPSLIPHWFTISVLGPHHAPLFKLDVSLLDYTVLSPSSHPVRRILPWYGLLARRELLLAWAVYPSHLPSPSPEVWVRRGFELDATLDPRPWEITPLVNLMLKESLRGHDRLERLSRLEVSRQIQPSRFVWSHPDGRFLVFTGTFWLSLCPETWLLQEYCECFPPKTHPDANSPTNTLLAGLVFITHPATGQEICLRPLLGHTFCPFPSVWDTAALGDGQPPEKN